MKQYLEIMQKILDHGHEKGDRTGTGTWSLFGEQMRFNLLRDGFPLVTTKKTHLRSIIYELLWFLRGEDNKNWLNEHGVTIWDEWAQPNGDLGPIYGFQWRSWPTPHRTSRIGGGVDQISGAVKRLRHNPDDRRIIVSAWNVGMLDDMGLPPCHLLFQFYSHELSVRDRLRLYAPIRWSNSDTEKVVAAQALVCHADSLHEHGLVQDMDRALIPRRGLSCQMYQRSCDWFLGVPFNIASYALLTMMMARVTGHAPYELIWVGGDCHVYTNHLDQARLQLSRNTLPLPKMLLNETVTSIDKFVYEDFKLEGYEHHPHIKAPIAV